jgi:hypothetical protein
MKLAKLAEVMLAVVLASGGLTMGAAAGASPAHSTGTPAPPRLPANFNWVGRYIVDDMHVTLPSPGKGATATAR